MCLWIATVFYGIKCNSSVAFRADDAVMPASSSSSPRLLLLFIFLSFFFFFFLLLLFVGPAESPPIALQPSRPFEI
jgi:hypothetical protein